MKPSPSPPAVGWVCISPIAIWSMRASPVISGTCVEGNPKQSLHELGIASLPLAMTDEQLRDEARKHWEIAKKMIDEMGYHRRDKEVEEIEKQL